MTRTTIPAQGIILAESAGRKSVEARQAAADAAQRAVRAKDRIAQIERGEDIAATANKPDIDKLLHEIGFTDADMRHWANVSRLDKLGLFEEYLKATGPDPKREQRAARRILRTAERRQRGSAT